eukprot:TRINITY_DN9981_c0_g1_i1.p1 TRINITY_DN9981_c0_g1~~TRINITY_DN9981_c0_g1_i1.p1  ORF type:complete len:135 (-),score=34.77 TRINITY_DN9981_c0_g1_i1:460-864(-)
MAGINQCEDFMMFQRALKQLRELDDKIIYALNLSTPTQSMRARGASPQQSCQELQTNLSENYKYREEKISNCVGDLTVRIKDLKGKADQGDMEAMTNLRPTQHTLRLMKNELNVEEIIRDRSKSIFDTKCKEYL